ncbi:MAG TPA: hypothetical protein VGK59_00265 [Ohtaekwangia sp.]
MKFIIQVIAIIITAYILELFAPWYAIAIAAFACGYSVKSNANFLAGFSGIAMLWLFKMWITDLNASENLNLAEAVSRIFPLNSKILLFLVTALIGGLVGGAAALTGSLLKPEKKRGYY